MLHSCDTLWRLEARVKKKKKEATYLNAWYLLWIWGTAGANSQKESWIIWWPCIWFRLDNKLNESYWRKQECMCMCVCVCYWSHPVGSQLWRRAAFDFTWRPPDNYPRVTTKSLTQSRLWPRPPWKHKGGGQRQLCSCYFITCAHRFTRLCCEEHQHVSPPAVLSRCRRTFFFLCIPALTTVELC